MAATSTTFADVRTIHFSIVVIEAIHPLTFLIPAAGESIISVFVVGIDYHKDGYDGFACCWYQKGKWMYSLYNDNGKVDCSDICKSRGGGGHKGASGFQSYLFLTE